ncbi:MAG: hypothetical protein MHM6MM_004594 [Cercozoa sp. M6MM]
MKFGIPNRERHTKYFMGVEAVFVISFVLIRDVGGTVGYVFTCVSVARFLINLDDARSVYHLKLSNGLYFAMSIILLSLGTVLLFLNYYWTMLMFRKLRGTISVWQERRARLRRQFASDEVSSDESSQSPDENRRISFATLAVPTAGQVEFVAPEIDTVRESQ